VTNPVPFLTLSIGRLVLGTAVQLAAHLQVPMHPESTELSAVT